MLSFYKSLYTTKLTDGQDPSIIKYFFLEEYNVHLSKAEETLCEGSLRETECLSSLKQMADSKTPGTDGLPAEFWSANYSACVVYTKTVIHLSVDECDGYLPPLRWISTTIHLHFGK